MKAPVKKGVLRQGMIDCSIECVMPGANTCRMSEWSYGMVIRQKMTIGVQIDE